MLQHPFLIKSRNIPGEEFQCQMSGLEGERVLCV